MKYTFKMKAAIQAVCLINKGSDKKPVSADTIAKSLDIPLRYLEQVLQKLVDWKILKSCRGPRGGYHLTRKPQYIEIRDIINCVIICEPKKERPQPSWNNEIVENAFIESGCFLMKKLENITIADLI